MAITRRPSAVPPPPPAPVPAAPSVPLVCREDAYIPTDDDRERVKRMVFLGVPLPDIGQVVFDRRNGKPFTPDELREHFPNEVGTGTAVILDKVGENLITIATTGRGAPAVAAALAILRARGDKAWQETTKVEVTNHEAAKAQTKEIGDALYRVMQETIDARRELIPAKPKSLDDFMRERTQFNVLRENAEDV